MAITAIRSDSYTPIASSIRFFLSALSLIFLLVAQANSAEDPPPNVFVDGQPIVAEDMNENFDSLHQRIATLEANVATLLSQTPGAGTGTVPGAGTGTVPGASTGTDAYFAYVEGGVLKSANLADGGGTSPSSSYSLVDGNDVVLQFISQGSLDLPRDFPVLDYDTKTPTGEQSLNYFGQHVAILFAAAADGSIDYSQQSVLSSDPSSGGNWVPLYYESTDCTGQGYLDANMLRTVATVYKLDGEWIRLPLLDLSATGTGITAKSTTNPTPFDSITCDDTNQIVNQAVIPIAYDPEPIRQKLLAPVRVVAPVP